MRNVEIDKEWQHEVLERFGIEYQSLVAVEELAELQKAITKLYRNPKEKTKPLAYRGYRDNLVEEIADVMICIAQMIDWYDITSEEIQESVTYKEVRMRYLMSK